MYVEAAYLSVQLKYLPANSDVCGYVTSRYPLHLGDPSRENHSLARWVAEVRSLVVPQRPPRKAPMLTPPRRSTGMPAS